MKVLARVPGFGGKSICDVIGETDRDYALSRIVQEPDVFDPTGWTDWPTHPERIVFTRRKTQCIPLGGHA